MSDESSRTPVATLVEIDVPIEISVRIGGARVVSRPSSPSARSEERRVGKECVP